MATKHNPDPNNPTSKEGKRMALELKHEHMLAEAKKAAEERKRACSVGDTLQSPKRGCVGRGKPRGRRGGRRQGSATVTSPPTEGFQSSSVEVLRTEPSAQHEFEKNMERLPDILSSCPPPEPQKSSASSWSFRQQRASERWKEARPHHLQCLLEKEAVGHPLCGLCHEPAVIRCRECLPEEWFCGDCEVLHHKKQPLHNRDSFINGFFKPISPTTCVVRVEGGYDTHDQACILPTVKAPNCSCKGTKFTVQQWTPDLKVLLKSGYWPASVSISTLYTLDLLSSFEELKVIFPGFSRQFFAKLLEHRTKCGGRSGPVNGDALQRSFLEFSYASYEEDQLCCAAPFICPACTPEMLAVSADGNRKLSLSAKWKF
ncbi:Protein wech [Dissostichus eleginoides]|uniref:Protein wech n=1 Tax=Dissostichus eleginoides TaxID=100907 RepID=A0AAD9CM60_DISEL|nr:Protein wech [Dissostichus eleginoides]